MQRGSRGRGGSPFSGRRGGKGAAPPLLPRGFLGRVKKVESRLRTVLEDAAKVQQAHGGGRRLMPVFVDPQHIYEELCKEELSLRRKPANIIRKWIQHAQDWLKSERQEAILRERPKRFAEDSSS